MPKTNPERCVLIGLTILLLCAESVFSQSLPPTNIWLAPLSNGVPGQPTKINPTGGYNNQPHFSTDDTVIYYTREIPGEEGVSQTDIAVFHLATNTTSMLTQTTESEYSPTPIPGQNALSVVQVEADQKQRLWAISTDTGEMELILPHAEPVGYHAWLNDHEVAMFILGDSFTLHIGSIGVNESRKVADNIGRTLRKHSHHDGLLFVDKNTEPWQIATYVPATNNISSVMPLFPASEDFTLDGNGNYWTGNGSKLYRRGAGAGRWELMADFSANGVSNISRLAINSGNDKIALVSEHMPSN